MSLRFDRKGASFRSKKKDKSKPGELDIEKQYYMSWTYRQCQFACDYLNLMDEPVGEPVNMTLSRVNGPPGTMSRNSFTRLSPAVEGKVSEEPSGGSSGFSRFARFGSFHRASDLPGFNAPRTRASIAACGPGPASFMRSNSTPTQTLGRNNNENLIGNRKSDSFSDTASFFGTGSLSRKNSYAESTTSSCSSRSSSYGFDFEKVSERNKTLYWNKTESAPDWCTGCTKWKYEMECFDYGR